MALTKTTIVVLNSITLVPATPQSASVTLDVASVGGSIYLIITNGATGPTIPARVLVEASDDGSTWYYYATIFGSVANNGIVSAVIPFTEGILRLKLTATDNTGQNVTVRGVVVEAK